MYEQVEKAKENKSRTITNSVAQKRSDVQQRFGFVDNRSSEAKDFQKMQFMMSTSSKHNKELVQMKKSCG